MCFSAAASFAAAAATGAAGAFAISRSTARNQVMFAAIPLLFSAHQAVEGLIWLQLTGVAPHLSVALLAALFQFIAKVAWPTLIPLAVMWLEPDPTRKRYLRYICWIGAAMGAVFTAVVLLTEHDARIVNGCIHYYGCVRETSTPLSYIADLLPNNDTGYVGGQEWLLVPYLISIVGALALSSYRLVQVFSGLVAIGFLIALSMYRSALPSVWCFFAALGSVTVAAQLLSLQRARLLQPD